MKKESQNLKSKKILQVIPVSRISMRIYALFAIILVIIPEWLAELAITLGNFNSIKQLPIRGKRWEEDPELSLLNMSFKELRVLARELRIKGYSRELKQALYNKLLKRLSK